ncbi:hypothetical protein HDA32_005746 [Spinactinospora alkalitolerans]|uniref:Uncharacterized protein n=1 Tax=Spinactinospora alkalitolerans TaxID=687207 RepID=A0A852U1A2_9ACTN|nr:hypothetical protein [Spinactinospora alkalitolerans]NYE50626.1 hypothetical protein [Spinactinospora alkalitolerans]
MATTTATNPADITDPTNPTGRLRAVTARPRGRRFSAAPQPPPPRREPYPVRPLRPGNDPADPAPEGSVLPAWMHRANAEAAQRPQDSRHSRHQHVITDADLARLRAQANGVAYWPRHSGKKPRRPWHHRHAFTAGFLTALALTTPAIPVILLVLTP